MLLEASGTIIIAIGLYYLFNQLLNYFVTQENIKQAEKNKLLAKEYVTNNDRIVAACDRMISNLDKTTLILDEVRQMDRIEAKLVLMNKKLDDGAK